MNDNNQQVQGESAPDMVMSEEAAQVESPQNFASRTKILGNIVHYLKEYPFLLVSMAGLIVLTMVLAFDVEKIKEFKLLLYAVILVPLAMQFYFEAQKQRAKHRSEREQQQHARQQAAVAAGSPAGTLAPAPADELKYSRKAIAGLIISLLVYAEIGDTSDADMLGAAMGSFIMGGVTLGLGWFAHRDIKNQRATGKGMAMVVIGLSALMMLWSLGLLVE